MITCGAAAVLPRCPGSSRAAHPSLLSGERCNQAALSYHTSRANRPAVLTIRGGGGGMGGTVRLIKDGASDHTVISDRGTNTSGNRNICVD